MKKHLLVVLVILTTLLSKKELFANMADEQNSMLNDKTAYTFVISNEAPGYLIDNLIKQGYGDSSLYAVTKHLQPLSGGAIPQWFLDSLAACPASSEVFTAKLFNFSSPFNNPIGIGTDGNLIMAQIYGMNFLGKEGYLTYADTLGPVKHKLFTKAKEPKYYIDAGSKTYQTSSGYLTTYYKAFAIAWAMQPTTFVISNEAPGYLIDNLIKQGYGDSCLYAVTKHLQPLSGGAIPQWFIDSLAACPANSEIFTVALSNFEGLNNPVGVNSDGTLIITGVYGREYCNNQGFSTLSTLWGIQFTSTDQARYYIDAGSRDVGGKVTNYKAFAIAWSLETPTTLVLTNEGGLIDNLIARGYGNSSLYELLVALQPNSGGIISDEFMATLAHCPAGSEIFTAHLSSFSGINNPIGINTDGTLIITAIYGKDYFGKVGYKTYSEPIVNEGRELFTYATSLEYIIDTGSSIDNHSSSVIRTYKAFAIAWSTQPTTFVITNEAPGYLIDNLIKQGYGDSCLYAVTKHLQPLSGGAIPQWFIDSLAACPANREIFTVALSNFAGLNNPVCINSDGTLSIQPIFGRDYYQKEGYATYSDTQQGVGRELFTYATSPEYYINAGQKEVNYGGGIVTNTTYYKAFAIAWELSSTFVLSNEEGGLIDRLIAGGYGAGSLYDALVALEPASGSVISQNFLDALSNCPAGSQIFTQKLNNYAHLNGAVCINTDGTVFTTTGIKGRDYYGDTGYSTYPTAAGARESFTYANNFNYYINAVNGGKTYKVFAIGWSQAPTSTLSVSTNTLNVASANGSTASFNVTSNINWTATSSQTWLSVNPSNGYGDGTVTLTAEANPTTSARTATVTISGSGVNSQTVSVTQLAGAATLTVSPLTIVIAETGGDTILTITSNTSWTVASDQSWLTFEPSSGSGDGTVILTSKANPSSSARSATVTVSATGATSKTVVVTQSGTVGDDEFSKATIYPNPFSNGFYIYVGKNIVTVSLFDICGRKILDRKTTGTEFIPAAWLEKGLYLIELTNNKKTICRIICKH